MKGRGTLWGVALSVLGWGCVPTQATAVSPLPAGILAIAEGAVLQIWEGEGWVEVSSPRVEVSLDRDTMGAASPSLRGHFPLQGGLEGTASQGTFTRSNGLLILEGEVRLTGGAGSLSAGKALLDLKKGTAVLSEGVQAHLSREGEQ